MGLTAGGIAERCREDGEFRLAARYWDGSLAVRMGEAQLAFEVTNGIIGPGSNGPADLIIGGPIEVWDKVLAAVPPPFFNDILPARAFGLQLGGNLEMFFQYYPALRRMVDIMREEANR